MLIMNLLDVQHGWREAVWWWWQVRPWVCGRWRTVPASAPNTFANRIRTLLSSPALLLLSLRPPWQGHAHQDGKAPIRSTTATRCVCHSCAPLWNWKHLVNSNLNWICIWMQILYINLYLDLYSSLTLSDIQYSKSNSLMFLNCKIRLIRFVSQLFIKSFIFT